MTTDELSSFFKANTTIDYEDGGDTYEHAGKLLLDSTADAVFTNAAGDLTSVMSSNVLDGDLPKQIPMIIWVMRQEAMRISRLSPEAAVMDVLTEAVAALQLYFCALLDLTCAEFGGEKPFLKVCTPKFFVGQHYLTKALNPPLGTFTAAVAAINQASK